MKPILREFELVKKYQDKCFKLIKEYDYYCEDKKKVIHSPKVGTIISQLRDGGFETNDGEYTYFWYTHLEEWSENLEEYFN